MSEFIGQEHLVGEGKIIRRIIESKVLSSLIFYGPASSGKTSLAHVIAKQLEVPFEQINAVLDGVKQLREIVGKAEKEGFEVDNKHSYLLMKYIVGIRLNKMPYYRILKRAYLYSLGLRRRTLITRWYHPVIPMPTFELHALDQQQVQKSYKLH